MTKLFSPYPDDGEAEIPLTSAQEAAIASVLQKIDEGEYRFVSHPCLCSNDHSDRDVELSCKDRYGFSIPTLLCSKCGLVRSAKVFDEGSNQAFYTHDYRSVYVGASVPPDRFFEDQRARGERLLNLWLRVVPGAKPASVFELGCGAGGILAPFSELGLACSGCDFDERYIAYGVNKGLSLFVGDCDALADETVDLFMLSHVMEHFLDPVAEMQKIIRKISIGGYLVVEVPGVLNVHKVYYDPIKYYQGAHAYSYSAQHLKVFFEKIGLEIVYGDEKSVFVLRKPADWEVNNLPFVFDCSLSDCPKIVKRHIHYTRLCHVLKCNPYYWKNFLKRKNVT